MLKNPARYINKVRIKSSGTTDTSQGRASTSPSSLNVGRYFNCAGKSASSSTPFTYFHAQTLPVCLKSTT